MLKVRFAEVSRNAMQELGVNLFTGATGYKDGSRARPQHGTRPHQTPRRTSTTTGPGKFTLSDFLNIFVFSNKYNIGSVVRPSSTKACSRAWPSRTWSR